MAASLWLCLHLPDLGLEVFTRGLPAAQAASPRVLAEPSQPGSSKLVVAQCNTAAAAAGLHCGTSLATARSICPALSHVERQPALEAIRLRELAEHLYGWSHLVSLAPPAAVVMEIGHSLRLFGPLPALCAELIHNLAKLGHQTTLGIGHTPGAASLLAPQALPIPKSPPDPAGVLNQLRRIPLSQANFEPKQVAAFRAMGLQHLGQVLDLPAKPMGRRFGKPLLHTLQHLTGARPDPRPVITPRPRFSSSLHFLADLTDTTALLFPMQRLLGELQQWLTRRQLLTRSIHWHLLHPGHPEQHLELHTAMPTLQRKGLLELTRLRLERKDLLPEVASLSLRVPASALSTLAEEHSSDRAGLDLFNSRTGQGNTTTDPSSLLDLFRARLGDDICTSISLQDDHRPEHAFRLVPAQAFPRQSRQKHQQIQRIPSQKDQHKRQAQPANHRDNTRPHPNRATASPGLPARPLWLLRQPKPVPAHTLTLLQGPERIDVGWWQASTPRDYFVARQQGERLCWVFQCPDSNRWYLHGLFA